MAKSIIPIKLIISLNSNGNATGAILQYKLNTDGSISQPKTVSVLGSIQEDVSTILATAIASAGESEQVNG